MDYLPQQGGARGRRAGRYRGQRGRGCGGDRGRRRHPVEGTEANRERQYNYQQLNGYVVEEQHDGGHRRGRGARGERGRGRGNQQAYRGEYRGGRVRGRGTGRGREGTHDVSGVTRTFTISDRFLRELKESSPREITLQVSMKPDSFSRLLNSGNVGNRDRLRLILGLFAKGCASTMNQMLNDMLACMLHSEFFRNHLKRYLSTLSRPEVLMYTTVGEVVEDVESIVTLVNVMLERFPSQADEIVVLDKLKLTVDQLSASDIPLPSGLIERVTDLVKASDDCVMQRELRQLHSSLPQALRLEDPPDDFRAVEVVPTSEELAKNQRPFLRPNIVDGAFKDLDQYLDVQFRLLREDFVGPLREGIATLPEDDVRRKRGSPNDLRLYRNAWISQPVCTFSGLTHKIVFDVSHLRRVNWSYSRRLIFGSLLCFSNDHFKTMKFAVVSNRNVEDLKKGIIEVRFMNGLDDVKDMQAGQLYTFAESPAYFEAYRHVLHRLQHITLELPLQFYIVKCEKNSAHPPRYLRPEHRDGEVPVMDLRSALGCNDSRARRVTVTDWDAWPPCVKVELDESQLAAIKTAMTREFALIQGPPGTGKTYLGLKVMRALIENRHVWDPARTSPILVVCYTNHALDQFLEGVLEFHKTGVIRVGGRSESEVLKNLNLNAITRRERQDHAIPGVIFHNQKKQRYEMHKMQDAMKETLTNLERRGVIGVKSISGIPCCELAIQLNDRGQFSRIGYSLLDEWLRIVCFDSQISVDPNRGTPGNDKPEAAAADNGQASEQESESAEADADDDEAKLLEAQRRMEGEEFAHLEDARAPENDAENAANQEEEANAVIVDELFQGIPEAEPDSELAENDQDWIVAIDRKRRNRKVHKGLSTQPMTQEEVDMVENIWDLDQNNRWRLYNYWMQKRKDYFQEIMATLSAEFEAAAERLNEIDEQESLHVLKGATIIGMTTTGAAKHHRLLLEVKPKIIVVEEAAEVYEAHIVTTLSASAEHLILIGDHQQLRPNPHVFRLAKEYKLDVSLFERMINNGMPCARLDVQHRMRPEIAELMKPIYNGLRNHESVYEYENIAGVKHNMFFIEHNQTENENEDLKSHFNIHEASFVAGLCRYLMLQGISSNKITVLTTYTGQVLSLKKFMPKATYNGVRITAVDNYQGEENDVIILSLVRSNVQGKIGFLKTSNRVCVALSRAKKGFYCIGNMTLLAKESELWRKIVQEMRNNGIVGPGLELCCQVHPDTSFFACQSTDFKNAPEGGCTRPCEFRLACGHVCALACHPYDRQHVRYKCRKKCVKKCGSGHQCQNKCYQECGKCTVPVNKIVPRCNHIQSIPCGDSPLQFRCLGPCSTILACGHLCSNKCGDKDCTKKCLEMVSKTWPCGHTANVRCYEQATYLCPEPCSDMLECEHPCVGTCGKCCEGRLHIACRSCCGRTLVCSHACEYPCTKNCPPCSRSCENACVHSKCHRECGELCDPCQEPCQWECAHYACTKLCGEPCDRPRCNIPCQRILKCGHDCIGLCGEKCPSLCRLCHFEKVAEIFFGDEDDPKARFLQLEDCGHIFEVKGLDRWMDSKEENEEGGVNIGLKQCPRCKIAVRRSLRYGNVVKQALQDIEMVKRRMLDQEQEMEITVRQLTREAVQLAGQLQVCTLFKYQVTSRESYRRRILDNFDLGLERNEFFIDNTVLEDESPSGKILQRLRDRRTVEEVTTIQNQIQFLPSIVDVANKIDKTQTENGYRLQPVCQKLLADLNELVTFLMRPVLSEQQLGDIQLMMEKVELELNFRILMEKLRPRLGQLTTHDKLYVRVVEDGLKDKRKRTREDTKAIRKIIKRLSDTYSVFGLSKAEKLEIVRAMGFKPGHWYKCRNGHVYAIGDCGGADERSRCPECKEEIGGQSHRLVAGNAPALEFDGSQAPAWPI
ncbi:NFX1-type zinc finger-containing protein 1-like [Corticium candelabrum]|uniref:NFX1-type zinc finger-containing protein 1-like n=1 Tax=Corticium candelabrum TaxID=121492 RepID=UPI002E26F959|nr:NFX1-type zinc finger-containing protein 1-like [Corticium candelabrum]